MESFFSFSFFWVGAVNCPSVSTASFSAGPAQLAELRQSGRLPLHDRGHAPRLQEPQQGLRPDLTAAEHQHSTAGVPVVLQVRDGGLQTAAVGAELPGVDGQQAAGLQGVPGGGQGVQHDAREVRQPGKQRLAGKADLRPVPCHQPRLHQGFRVLVELKQHVFHSLLDASPLAEEHHGIRGQVVRPACGVRVDQVQVAVQSIDLRAAAETLRVSPESLGDLLSVFFLSVLDGQLFDLLRQMGKPVGGQSR